MFIWIGQSADYIEIGPPFYHCSRSTHSFLSALHLYPIYSTPKAHSNWIRSTEPCCYPWISISTKNTPQCPRNSQPDCKTSSARSSYPVQASPASLLRLERGSRAIVGVLRPQPSGEQVYWLMVQDGWRVMCYCFGCSSRIYYTWWY